MHEPTSNNKRIAYNTLLLYMRMLFLVLISLYTSRIVLKVLGVEDFGINNVVGGVITFLGFLTGSLAGASSRFITFALGKNDKENLKRVFGNIVTIHALFSLFVLAVGETVGLWFMMTQLNIPPERETAAFWVYQFSILTAMGSLVSAPYNAAIIAHEKMSAFAYLTIGDAVLKLSSVFILTVLPYDKLILYAFFILCIQFFDFILYIIYCTRHFEECRLRRMVFDREMFREIFSYAFAADIVGRGQLHIRGAVRDYQAMTVTYARVESELFVAEAFLQKRDEFARFVRGDFARRIVLHRLVGKIRLIAERHEVGTHRDVVVLHIYTYREGFEGTSARIAGPCVVSERAEIGDVAAGFVTVGHRFYQSDFARCGEHIHIGFAGDFEGSFPAQRGCGIVRHTVSKYQCEFHSFTSLIC